MSKSNKELFLLKQEQILVLDFGSQYNQLITRKVRQLGVYAQLVDHEIKASEIDFSLVKGIILSGGPSSVYETNAYDLDPEIWKAKVPILGICYGMQLMQKHFGGLVEASSKRQFGVANLNLKQESKLFKNTAQKQTVLMSHGDEVLKLAKDFEVLAASELCPLAAVGNLKTNHFGVQFHPEVTLSEYGEEILKNFLFEIVKISPNWTMEHFIQQAVSNLRQEIGKEEVILALSGGVDSSVTAALLKAAIDKQLHCLFIDHGLLRSYDVEEVLENFAHDSKYQFHLINAQKEFLSALKDLQDPEKKRQAIGKTFIKVFEKEAQKFQEIKFLAQGTLYTDVIESGTKTAQTIKSHHNVGGLPKKLKFSLVEPLKLLFKDEVRELGLLLGLKKSLIQRQPFPGPGIAIRIIGEVTEEKIKLVQKSDVIFKEELQKGAFYDNLWQAFTCLTNTKTVGVMGDVRTYEYVLALRAVHSIDGLTATFAKIPYQILEKTSQRIINEVSGINRVVYDITSKPPGTIEWE